MSGLRGSVAFVTGAARPPGIGRAVALRLARDGADVVCVDTAPAGDASTDSNAVAAGALAAVADEIKATGRRALVIELDPTDPDATRDAVARAVTEFDRLDICAHFAGGTGPLLGTGPLVDIEEAAWDRCLDANLISTWIVSRACAEHMVRQGDGGAIVALASFAARNTPEGYGAFSAARAGVVRMIEVFATELAPAGIRANAVLPLGVEPGAMTNPGLEQAATRDGDLDGWVRRHIPLGRLQSADEVAAVTAFLCGPDASFVSGQAIAVSGGAVR